LTAVLAADLAGYGRLMSAAEEDTLGRFKMARKELRTECHSVGISQ
jgi:hypothetical protein